MIAAATAGIKLHTQASQDSVANYAEMPGVPLNVIEDKTGALAKIGQSGQWIHVQDPNGHQGYVAGWYVEKSAVTTPTPTPQPAPAPTPPGPSTPPTPAPGTPPPASGPQRIQVVVLNSVGASGLTVRQQPSPGGSAVNIEKAGARLTVIEPADTATPKIGVAGQWVAVKASNNQRGYVMAQYITVETMRRSSRTALIIWAAITLLVAASLLVIYVRLGTDGFKLFIQQPPLINLPVTLASVTLLWLSVGALLYLIQSQRVNVSNLPSVAGFFLVCWVYLNILSERFRYGDYTYYLDAATSLYRNQPLPGSYFYPPLWATLLQFLVPFGQDNFFIVLWLLNVISLLGLYILLLRMLERYGFSPRLSALVTTLFMLVNVPLLRTLVYVQVNLHALDFILLSLLFYPKRTFLSALMLAIAIHLKASPAVLVLAFLLEKDWRWLAWFAISMILLAGITVVTDGISPFFDILSHLQGLALSNNTIFHDTSFDSFLRFADPLLHISLLWTRVLIYAAKALLAAATIWVMVRCARSQAFFRPEAQTTGERGAQVLNAIPPLFILMTLASPVVWEHHGIFLALAFLVLLKRLESPAQWYWFGFAYLLEFLLPTFDFFPWSFGRLAAPLIILGLMWVSSRSKSNSTFFVKTNQWLESLGAT